MDGLMLFTLDVIVGKKKEFATRTKFLLACIDDETGYNHVLAPKYGYVPHEEQIYDGCVRYFPKGTEDSQMEFGEGEGVYQFVDKLTKGAFEVWCL